MSAEGMYTDTRTLTVQNPTQSDIACRLEGLPSWLTAAPEVLECAAGETEQISLRGRAGGFLVYASQLKATLQVIVEGHPHPFEVRVSMRPPASRRRRRKNLIKAAAVGLVSITLAGLVIWLVWMFLPLL
jgi:hypothetical protein